jgi:transcriptional regulator with XRE-family HTH domain
MMMSSKKQSKAEEYSDKILDDFLNEISPEDQEWCDFKMEQAARIYDAMKKKGVNQIQFAEQMKVSPSLVSKWLSGTQNLTSRTLWQMQKVLGVSLVLSKDQPKEMVRVLISRSIPASSFNNLNTGMFTGITSEYKNTFWATPSDQLRLAITPRMILISETSDYGTYL